jgi:CRP/FNR family transcriptional regulator, cyclic AMP receptor protein
MNRIFPQQSDHPLFRYFTDEERHRIERTGEVKTVREDQYLIRARDKDSTLFAVEEGHLDIVVNRDGKDVVVATVGPGDVLGEVSFIDDSARSTSVRAGEENAVVRGWDKKALTDALMKEPLLLAKFSVALAELLVERLRDTARRV